jgi:hypothetical protein
MPLLCYTVKHLFYIPPILVVWRPTTSQTGAFATVYHIRSRGRNCSRTGKGLGVFQNRVLRAIFGLSREGVTAGLRKLHSEEPHNL